MTVPAPVGPSPVTRREAKTAAMIMLRTADVPFEVIEPACSPKAIETSVMMDDADACKGGRFAYGALDRDDRAIELFSACQKADDAAWNV